MPKRNDTLACVLVVAATLLLSVARYLSATTKSS
jgi:hypothetical protein